MEFQKFFFYIYVKYYRGEVLKLWEFYIRLMLMKVYKIL